MTFADIVHDAKTIWAFAKQLKNLGLEHQLFNSFSKELDTQGFHVKSGLIVDGSFVEEPRRRNARNENKQIKNGDFGAMGTLFTKKIS